MKKLICLFLSISLLLCGCSKIVNDDDKTEEKEYIKSIWIAYYELEEFTKDHTEKEFTDLISDTFSEIKNDGFNTVTVQVRPCSDAFYVSSVFPTSIYFNGTQGESLPYDPLSIMCDKAKKYNLHLEVWINPYRVSQDNDFNKLSDSNPAYIWKNEDYVKVCDGKIYYNPAYNEVTNLIVDGVKEIVENYDIYAIHFDDYFYPTTDTSFDDKAYQNYVDTGGTLSLDDWRRNNVSNMIKSVYTAIKSINANVKFGISPASNIENDYNNLYADIYTWINDDGYIDYICPQIYFGFKNVYQPFMITTKKWKKLCENSNVELYIGLGLYKANEVDNYAAENDETILNEYIDNNDIISRQINYISKLDKINGYYIFSYSSLNSEQAKDEVSNMLEVMQNSSRS